MITDACFFGVRECTPALFSAKCTSPGKGGSMAAALQSGCAATGKTQKMHLTDFSRFKYVLSEQVPAAEPA